MVQASAGRATCSDRVRALRDCAAGERADAIEQLGALLCSVQAELLDVITAADAEGDWVIDGATGMAPWLVGMLHVSTETARAWVRTGAALDGLPQLRDAFGEGVLSFDQIKPATSFVTPDTDAEEAQRLPGLSAAQVEDLARQHRVMSRRRASDAGARRFFRSRVDHDHGGRRFSGFLPEAEAARLDTVLDRLAEQAGPDAETGLFDPIDTRRADALADDLHIARDSVLRLLCDAKIEFSIDGPDGTTIGIARTGRSIPRWLRRRLQHRDGSTCRFPGCNRRMRHLHHLHHWATGGPTDASNLVGLCWHHHRLVHEGAWTITGNPDHGHLTFTSPHGRKLRSRPQPLRHDTRTRAAHAAGPRLHDPPTAAQAGGPPDRS